MRWRSGVFAAVLVVSVAPGLASGCSDDGASSNNPTSTSGNAPASVQQGQTGNTTQDSVDDLNKTPPDGSVPTGGGTPESPGG